MTTAPAKKGTAVGASIHPDTRLGHVHLNVASLDRQVDFYTKALGLKLMKREGRAASLGVEKRELLRFAEITGARQVPGGTGLYHLCLLLPEHVELAYLLRNLLEMKVPLQGLVDHHVSEAVYLPDAEGNGIELDWDRPRDQWPAWPDMARMSNGPLDVDGLMAEIKTNGKPWPGLGPDTTIGHVHLHVAALKPAEDFYRGVIGFEKTFSFPGQAGFVSAGGYHHHVAFNIWNGVGAAAPPAGSTGLRYFTVMLPDQKELDRVLERVKAAGLTVQGTKDGWFLHDPSGNGVLLSVQK